MNIHAEKTQEDKSETGANAAMQRQSAAEPAFRFADNRPEAIAQRQVKEGANNSSRVAQLRTLHESVNNSPQATQGVQLQALANPHSATRQLIQKKENTTGLPDSLKTGIESLSGMSLDDVKLHRNSAKPAQLQAHAYAQGTDIHLGPGQEQHLPHEAWHVVQQKQGRVKPTMQMKGSVAVNDDGSLEKEADVMGAKALQLKGSSAEEPSSFSAPGMVAGVGPVQRQVDVTATQRGKTSVVIEAEGEVEDFAEGEDAKNYGWNGVTKYKADALVGDTNINIGMTNNRFIVGQAGHVLAQQNGGDGSDGDNVFAQDGGVNNGPYRSNFENPMRKALDQTADDEEVRFRAVLYGDKITKGKLSKESDNLEGSDEDTDFEGF
ncbi:DUF4157 domain-containing protein [Hymenobacter sp. BT175]|uniref:eCIS core domain-containing protein n=1 Tax=Hymenobacter translucens TaxID=2886507 RepID=UPI001D0E3A7D|nr:DUF4157 domain-containing protein [Hymenobacter translucens]MCC2546537.1 DUF4157 domain-containing protein [Hymenobacter translucens]